MKITIRKAGRKDTAAILGLNKKLFDYESRWCKTYNLGWTYSEKGRKYFGDRVGGKGGLVLVAEVKDKVVGYLACGVDNYAYRSLNPVGEIENMWVEEDFRDKGVGKKLVEGLKEELKQKGVKLLKVETLSRNAAALGFYKFVGLRRHVEVLEGRL
jgi:ribosomal protein S18 acetylase RimI-like enzyme